MTEIEIEPGLHDPFRRTHVERLVSFGCLVVSESAARRGGQRRRIHAAIPTAEPRTTMMAVMTSHSAKPHQPLVSPLLEPVDGGAITSTRTGVSFEAPTESVTTNFVVKLPDFSKAW